MSQNQYWAPSQQYSRLHVSKFKSNQTEIAKLKLKEPLFFESPDFEIKENKTNVHNAILILLANRFSGSGSIWSRIPYDIVKIIAKEVAEPVCLMYLPIIVNGKKYRIKLEPVE